MSKVVIMSMYSPFGGTYTYDCTTIEENASFGSPSVKAALSKWLRNAEAAITENKLKRQTAKAKGLRIDMERDKARCLCLADCARKGLFTEGTKNYSIPADLEIDLIAAETWLKN